MNIFPIVANQVVVLGLVLLAGLGARKLGVLDDRFKVAGGAYITNLALPCVAMSNILSPSMQLDTYSDAGMFVLAALLSIGVIFLLSLGTGLALHCERTIIPLQCIGACTFNIFAFSLPVLTALYGETAVFYSMLLYVAGDACMWTFEVYTVRRFTGDGGPISLRGLISPALCALVFAVCCKLAGIELPQWLYDSISAIGGTMKVMCLILLGVVVGSLSLRELFCDLRVYLFAAAKLLLIPFLLSLFFFGVTDFGMSHEAVMTLLLTFSVAPVSVLPTIAKNYGGDDVYTTKLVTLSTLLCIGTVPLMSAVFTQVYTLLG
ncbi:MAG: AEC family transporter [Eubacteriales bacterium]